MSETAHTPGPWSARHNGHYWQIQAGDYDLIGDACASQFDLNGLKSPETLAKAEANARLIAAAPELLESMQRYFDARQALRDLENNEPNEMGRRWKDARHEVMAAEMACDAAIAKAEGR